ncbi:MAG TPA: CBS domain-containing protein, partial [Clostridia bacterium]|nr:CBS domain-containing protein [Clostridia bacterium]
WQETVRGLLALVNMRYAEYAHKYPSELSGGQQQRIGVLRALAASPPIVLMDEPFGALDPITRETLQDEIKRIQKKLQKTIVFVTHDMEEALRLADTIIFMDQGRIVQSASPEEMLAHPAAPIVRSFLGRHMENANGIPAQMRAEDFMRSRVYKVPKTAHILECIDLMRRRDVNSLIVLDEDEKYAGTVWIDTIRIQGKTGQPILELITQDVPTVRRTDDAREAFDKLFSATFNYVVVLEEDGRVAGIITRTSTAKALGEALWGEMPS